MSELPGLPDRFEVRERIGRGGMATVYLAHDRAAGADVALKVLHAHLRDDPLVAARFQREIAAVRRVRHPNVIAIHDLLASDALLCLVMEYHPGVDLKRKLRRDGPLPGEAVRAIGLQILAGLGAAHAEGVVHRDVKPHNVLLDDHGQVKVTDFGLARVDDLAGLTTHTLALGTPDYMAPELLASPAADSRADLYGVGVTLFELATGKLPFRGGAEALLARRDLPPPDPRALAPGLPEDLAAAIRHAMAFDPEERFQTAAEMAAALAGTIDLTAPRANPLVELCARCRAPLLPRHATCVECGFEPITIESGPRRRGHPRYRVVVRTRGRLRRRADPLTFQQKHALVETLRELGGDIALSDEQLDARLRSLPAVAADGLTLASARKLLRALAVRHVPGRIRRHGLLGFLPHLTQPGALATGLLTTIISSLALTVVGLPGLGFLAPLIGASATGLVALSDAAPLARFSGRAGANPALQPLAEAARATFAEVTSPRARRLLRRVLAQGMDARALLAERPALALRVDADRVDHVLHAALAEGRRLARLEAECAGLDPAELVEQLATLDERLAAAPSVEASARIIADKRRVAGLLERHEVVQREIAQRVGDLLTLAGRLGGLRARLTSAPPDDEQANHGELSTIVAELGFDLDAERELPG